MLLCVFQKPLLVPLYNEGLLLFFSVAVYPFTFENTTKTPAAPERIDSEIEVYETSDSVPTKQVAVIVSWEYRSEFPRKFQILFDCKIVVHFHLQRIFLMMSNPTTSS